MEEEVTVKVDVSASKLVEDFGQILKLIDGLRVVVAQTDDGEYAYLKGISADGKIVEVRVTNIDIPNIYAVVRTPDGAKESEIRLNLPTAGLWNRMYDIISNIEDGIIEMAEKKYSDVRVKIY